MSADTCEDPNDDKSDMMCSSLGIMQICHGKKTCKKQMHHSTRDSFGDNE